MRGRGREAERREDWRYYRLLTRRDCAHCWGTGTGRPRALPLEMRMTARAGFFYRHRFVFYRHTSRMPNEKWNLESLRSL